MIVSPRLWLGAASALVIAALASIVVPTASQAADSDIALVVPTAGTVHSIAQWHSVEAASVDQSAGTPADALGVLRASLADVVSGSTTAGSSALECAGTTCLPSGTDALVSAASVMTGDVLAVSNGATGTPRAMVARSGQQLAGVAVNDTAEPIAFSIDVSGFAFVSRNATVTTLVAQEAGFASSIQTVATTGDALVVSIPANSMAVLTLSVSTEDYTGVDHIVLSAHARGKAMVLGAAGARDALHIETLGTNAAVVQPQVLTFYAVEGSPNTFVIASDLGVMALSDLPSPDDRRVLSLDISVEQAMANTYAQWKLLDDGDGTVSFHNVHGYWWAGASAAELNLSNWHTEDGSAVNTWDDTNDAVGKWRLYDTTGTATAVTGLVTDGVEPTLPSAVSVRYGWGATEDVAVTWVVPSDAAWGSDGHVTVAGSGTTMFGNQLTTEAVYTTVAEVGAEASARLSTYAGIPISELKKLAPTTVERDLSGTDLTLTSAVSWDWEAIAASDLATAGAVVTVPAVDGLGFSASLEITLLEPTISSLWKTPAVPVERRLTSSNAISYDNAKLYDNNKDVSAGGDWQRGIRLSPATLTWTFSDPAVISRVGLSDFSSSNPAEHPIGTVTFEYLDVTGAWVPIPSDRSTATVNSGSSTGTRANVVVDFPPVVAYGYRVTYTNTWAVNSGNGASWVQLSEIVLAGPSAPLK